MKIHVCILIALLTSKPGLADELLLGLGIDDLGGESDESAAAILLEYHTDPFFEGRRTTFSWAGALEVDDDRDLFVGIGVHARWSLGDSPWFIEGSFMPGYYGMGASGNDLGGNLQFRSLIGLGYELNSGNKISIAIDHKSNAGIDDLNPGEEMLVVRYSFKF